MTVIKRTVKIKQKNVEHLVSQPKKNDNHMKHFFILLGVLLLILLIAAFSTFNGASQAKPQIHEQAKVNDSDTGSNAGFDMSGEGPLGFSWTFWVITAITFFVFKGGFLR